MHSVGCIPIACCILFDGKIRFTTCVPAPPVFLNRHRCVRPGSPRSPCVFLPVVPCVSRVCPGSPRCLFTPPVSFYRCCTGVCGCEVRPCDPFARVRPCVPCVPCVSRLPPVSFYRFFHTQIQSLFFISSREGGHAEATVWREPRHDHST